MRIEVAGSPEHENMLEQYAFTFNPGTLRLQLVGYNRYNREHELAPWVPGKFWQYPDLKNESTLPEQSPPEWAITDAKTYILSKIQY